MKKIDTQKLADVVGGSADVQSADVQSADVQSADVQKSKANMYISVQCKTCGEWVRDTGARPLICPKCKGQVQ